MSYVNVALHICLYIYFTNCCCSCRKQILCSYKTVEYDHISFIRMQAVYVGQLVIDYK